MQRDKAEKSQASSGRASRAGARTGRDGAVDFALNLQEAEAEADAGEHVYRVIEVVGSSSAGIEAAIDAALTRAHRTLRNLRWFEVVRTSGHIEHGKVRHYQVTLKVGFTMEEPGA
jgi:dodecin